MQRQCTWTARTAYSARYVQSLSTVSSLTPLPTESFCLTSVDVESQLLSTFTLVAALSDCPLTHCRCSADLKDNTTWHLVADMEQLRELLQIEKWVVFGGSWGSTLSLTYGIKHTDRCLALILRGIFMLRRSELEWFYEQKGGALNAYPDAWEEYLKPIPEEERGELIKAYYKRLTSDDQAVRSEAAKAWSIWEGTTSKLVVDADAVKKYGGDEFADAFARVECHYFLNGGFFETDAWILENAHKLKEVPGVIVQGRYDIVCPARSAWDLHRVWPEAEFHMVQDAGHNAYEPGIKAELLDACDLFAQKLAK